MSETSDIVCHVTIIRYRMSDIRYSMLARIQMCAAHTKATSTGCIQCCLCNKWHSQALTSGAAAERCRCDAATENCRGGARRPVARARGDGQLTSRRRRRRRRRAAAAATLQSQRRGCGPVTVLCFLHRQRHSWVCQLIYYHWQTNRLEKQSEYLLVLLS